MNYSEVIRIRLNRICEERNLTCNGLANLSGIRQSTLRDIMVGASKDPRLSTLHRIATGLDMTVSELLDFDEMNNTIFEDE